MLLLRLIFQICLTDLRLTHGEEEIPAHGKAKGVIYPVTGEPNEWRGYGQIADHLRCKGQLSSAEHRRKGSNETGSPKHWLTASMIGVYARNPIRRPAGPALGNIAPAWTKSAADS